LSEEAVVLLETSIVAQGLPPPHNLEAAFECERAIREAGAVPKTVGVLEGELRIGLSEAEIRRLAEGAEKVSSRDLGWAVAGGRPGATTVAATLRAARLSGARFLATGGVGGVHLGRPEDVSADLFELSRTVCAVFCAGPKSVLDVGLTLERLESLAVPVLGWHTDRLPAFYVRETEHCIPRIDGVEPLRRTWELGGQGVVVAVPPPRDLPDAARLVAEALKQTDDAAGPDLTPRLLAKIAELSGGRSVELNVELVVNNAREAARAAVDYFS
jgi:pseudouridylate synthase